MEISLNEVCFIFRSRSGPLQKIANLLQKWTVSSTYDQEGRHTSETRNIVIPFAPQQRELMMVVVVISLVNTPVPKNTRYSSDKLSHMNKMSAVKKLVYASNIFRRLVKETKAMSMRWGGDLSYIRLAKPREK